MRKSLLAILCFLAAGAAMAAADVNKAQPADLDGINGIGPDTSRRILAERQKSPFKDWKDFMARVKGIGPAKAEKLSGQGLTVNGQGFKKAVAAPAAAAK